MSLAENLRALIEAATPGPWRVQRAVHQNDWPRLHAVDPAHPDDPDHDRHVSDLDDQVRAEDTDLIVTLRNAAPALVALVEAVEAHRIAHDASLATTKALIEAFDTGAPKLTDAEVSALDEKESSAMDRFHETRDAMFAALAAIDGDAP